MKEAVRIVLLVVMLAGFHAFEVFASQLPPPTLTSDSVTPKASAPDCRLQTC